MDFDDPALQSPSKPSKNRCPPAYVPIRGSFSARPNIEGLVTLLKNCRLSDRARVINAITVCGEALVVVMSACPSGSTPCWIRKVPPAGVNCPEVTLTNSRPRIVNTLSPLNHSRKLN